MPGKAVTVQCESCKREFRLAEGRVSFYCPYCSGGRFSVRESLVVSCLRCGKRVDLLEGEKFRARCRCGGFLWEVRTVDAHQLQALRRRKNADNAG